MTGPLDIRVPADGPVVALESTLIAHGLPHPLNVETALAAEAAVRAEGATPATIAILDGRPTIGLTPSEIERLSTAPNVFKASRRDLGASIALKRTAATTVAATMALAHRAGIRVFATGGIGGVHRGAETTFDISADLLELSRTPVAVVCAGAKSILDIPKTVELLEALGVPVVGVGTDRFPAFTVRESDRPVSVRVDSPTDAASVAAAHIGLGGGGVLVVQPAPADVAVPADEFAKWLATAEARVADVSGADVTPALLRELAAVSGGRTLSANRALVVANARLAARLACAWPRPD